MICQLLGPHIFVHVGKADNRIHMANGYYYANIDLVNMQGNSTIPLVSEHDALSISKSSVGNNSSHYDTTATRLVVLPHDDSFYLAWEVLVIPTAGYPEWLIYVNAADGEILKEEDILCHINGTGRVYPIDPNTAYTNKTLYRLTYPGYGLDGSYVSAENDDTGEAFSTSRYFVYSPTNTHFDEVNVYYHADIFAYDFIGLGYPGLPSAIPAIVHYGSDWDGASYSPTFIELRFGDGNTIFYDLAKKNDVVYHEYMHAISDDIGLERGTNESTAMSEGYSDYFAATFTDDPVIGEWVCQSENNLRTAYTDKNRWNYSNWLNADSLYYNSLTNFTQSSAYARSMIWSGAVWDLRMALNNDDLTDELIYCGLEYANGNSTFLQGRSGIIQYDMDTYSGAHVSTIKTVFADRGIGNYPVSVNISGPSSLGYKEYGTFTANVSGGSGTISYQWYKKLDGSGYWQERGTNQSQLERMYIYSFTMKVVVTRGSEQAEDQHICYYGSAPKALPSDGMELPLVYALEAAYPNPFNPSTTVRYDLPEASRVSLTIYDIMGREVTRWQLAEEPGYKELVWQGNYANGQSAPAGIYIYRLEATSSETGERFVASKKMVLMK